MTQKAATMGVALTIIGALMLGSAFGLAYFAYRPFLSAAQSSAGNSSASFVGNLGSLLFAAIVIMFLGIMGWIGSIMLVRGVDFMKVDKGIGIMTFKLDKTTGIVSSIEMISGKSRTEAGLAALDMASQEKS